jgi:undecaprenyl diphosphate synthase
MNDLDPKKLPRHVAIIMDGNGRWAKKKAQNRVFGHEEGANAVRDVVRCARKVGVSYLSLYVFSKENWKRPKMEISALWRLLKAMLRSELPELIENEVRLRHIGDREGIPRDILEEMDRVQERTAEFDKLVLSLCVNYGGRQEIAYAARMFAADVEAGRYRPEDCTPELLSRYLYAPEIPNPDLLIRTSGEYRISNFLLWQLAYSEIYITSTLWPDFREQELVEAIRDYQKRERRFGRTSDQLKIA